MLQLILTIVFYLALFFLVGIAIGVFRLARQHQLLLKQLLELSVPLAATTTNTLTDTNAQLQKVDETLTLLSERLSK